MNPSVTSQASANTRVGALAVEGESDQVRALPVAPAAAERQRSIVESAAHPQPPARGIDADQGYDDEIEPSRRDRGAPMRRGTAMPNTPRRVLPVERIEAYPAMAPVD